MKILILHHVEPIWESGLLKFAKLSFNDLEEKFYEHFQENQYDKVILTRFEDWKINDDYNLIGQYINKVETYDYGWTKELCEQNELEYCEGGNHSEVVWIADWQKELKGHEVYISGGFRGACLEDLQIALDHLNINYKEIKELCY